MLTLLEAFFHQFGYAAVFLVLVVCGFGVPIPEDITLVAGGIMSGLGHADVAVMYVVGMAGVLVGDGMMFLLGKYYGTNILRVKFIAKLLSPKRYAQVQYQFDKYGNRVLFVARFLPGLRSPIFLTAGMSGKVSFWQWLIMDGLAALISVPIWVYLGNLGAENRDWLMAKIHQFQNIFMIILSLIVLAVLGVWWNKRQSLVARKNALLAKRREKREARKRAKQEKLAQKQ